MHVFVAQLTKGQVWPAQLPMFEVIQGPYEHGSWGWLVGLISSSVTSPPPHPALSSLPSFQRVAKIKLRAVNQWAIHCITTYTRATLAVIRALRLGSLFLPYVMPCSFDWSYGVHKGYKIAFALDIHAPGPKKELGQKMRSMAFCEVSNKRAIGSSSLKFVMNSSMKVRYWSLVFT